MAFPLLGVSSTPRDGTGLMSVQRTLRRATSCAGIGLHSGSKVTLSLRPAPADFGIRFRRADLGGLEVPAPADHVVGINYATGLARDAVKVDTVEHLLAALVSMNIDNVLRPVLIKRGADLPLLLIFAGVIGGLLAFGIIGLFIGPVVLAVAYTLWLDWLDEEREPALPVGAQRADSSVDPDRAAARPGWH